MHSRIGGTRSTAILAGALMTFVAACVHAQGASSVAPRRASPKADTSIVIRLQDKINNLSAAVDAIKRENTANIQLQGAVPLTASIGPAAAGTPVTANSGPAAAGTPITANSGPATAVPQTTQHSKLHDFFISNDPAGCSLPADRGARFCGLVLDPQTETKVGARFWGDSSGKSLSLFNEVQVQGLGDGNSQSTYVELARDYWGLWRVALSGVFKSTDSTSSKSKAQQFLNGGGPAQLTLLRPIALLNGGLVQTTLLGHAKASFTVPGQDSTARDSLSYADFGAEMQSRIDGADSKLGGFVFARYGRIVGGHAFYTSVSEPGAFSTLTAGVGITVEGSVAVIWNRVLAGPQTLRNANNLITVQLIR